MTDLPAQDIALDLDAAQRPAEDVVEPFAARVGGKRIVMTDPQEIDWQDLLEIEDPAGFLRHCVSKEDRDHLRGLTLPGWKFGKLIDAYLAHYRLEEKMEEARRRQTRRF